MNKGTIIKYSGIVIGAITMVVLASKHPIPIIILGICATIYFVGEAVEKGEIKL